MYELNIVQNIEQESNFVFTKINSYNKCYNHYKIEKPLNRVTLYFQRYPWVNNRNIQTLSVTSN